jgi:predicted cupin superfamily sugar epimerase
MAGRGHPMDPDQLIAALGLAPHPEGGWYAETWREPAPAGTRPAGSAIHFLLRAGERSSWHRVDATEVWHHYAGDALLLEIASHDGTVTAIRLGDDIADGERPQAVVPAGAWQQAHSLGAWTLVGCTVAPAFRFEGFELAPQGWSPGSSADGPPDAEPRSGGEPGAQPGFQ